jgi:hypothetical protein
MKKRKTILLTGSCLLAALLPALLPLLRGHLPWRADGLLHFYRLAQLDRAVAHGLLYPRWLPDLGFGFGFPLFNYYAPFSYYVVLPLTRLGIPVETAVRVSYILALLLLAGGLYWWAARLFGREAGVVAALTAVYAPYLLFDVHHRGVLPEVWGLAWLALALAALHWLWSRPGPAGLGLLAFSYAGLLLSHNILALVGTPLLLGYLLFLWWSTPQPPTPIPQPPTPIPQSLLALLLGLGLSAFFWLPAFFERDLVQIHKLYDSANFYYGNHFLAWNDLLALPQTAVPAQVNPAIPFAFGLLPLLLAVLNLLPGDRDRSANAHRLALALLVGLFSLLMLPLSLPAWDRLPLVEFIQFPWRLLGPATLLLAALAGAGIARLPQRWRGPGAVVGSGAMLLLALPWLFPGSIERLADPTPLDVIGHEIETGALGTTAAGDYLPVQVEQLPAADRLLPLYETAAPDYLIARLDPEQLPPDVAILDAAYGLTAATIHYRAESEGTAVFHWFYFPGWQAEINGRAHPLTASHPQGLLQVDLPAGEHRLHIEFGTTPLRRGATAVSWLSLLLLLAGFVWWWLERDDLPLRRQERKENPEKLSRLRLSAVKNYALLLIALFGLGLAGLKTVYLDQADTIFRRSQFDGQQVSGLAHPLQVNFDQQLILLGYELDTPQTPADGLVDLTLYWRAAQPLAQEFSTAIHLLDDQGRRYGQQDSFHPAGLPTTRWQMAEYARDRHQIALWPGTPPGEYRLLVRVYERENGRLRPILNEIGQPVATEYELATVTVTPARRQPEFEPAQPLEAPLHDGLWLLGTDSLPATLQTGDQLVTTFFWRAQTQPTADYRAEWQLVDEAGTAVAGHIWSPGRVDFPPSQWPAGQLVRDEQRFLIPAGLPHEPTTPLPDGRYTLELGLLNESGQAVGERVQIGELTILAPARRFDLPAEAQPLAQEAVLGTSENPLVHLRGYRLEPAAITPGQAASLTLYWQSLSPTTTGYTVFAHLLGADGTILAQSDHIPAAGSRPTMGWLPGEIVADTAVFHLPADAPPGPYQFRVGLYDPLTGQRLPLLDTPDKDAILIDW